MSSPNSEKCTCDDSSPQDSDSTNGDSTSPKNTSKPTTRSLTSFFKRRGRSLIGKNGKHTTSSSSSTPQACDGTGCCGMTSTGVHESERRSQKWLPGRRKTKATQIGCCCACYRRNEENVVVGGEARRVSSEDVAQEAAKPGESGVPEVSGGDDETPHVVIENVAGELRREDMVFFSQRFMPNVHFTGVFFSPRSLEDVEEEARIERAREIERGVDPPPSFRPPKRIQVLCNDVIDQEPQRFQLICPADVTIENLKVLFPNVHIQAARLDNAGCHTQIDFIHCLVPDLLNITNCSFYWGKMDRYEAERLLDGKREGTFLLRDSAQEEFLFSVSFRKYGRSLHARIEQWNHRFSFDSHDPGVYTSDTVCGLIEHYKDPSSCMFFEPMLTWPLHRNTVFSLQHLCRATIASKLSYDDIRHLQLPKSLKLYLKEYHYRQKVRVARFDEDLPSIDIRNTSNLPFHAK